MITFRMAIATLLMSGSAWANEQTKPRPIVSNLHLQSVQLSSLDIDSAEFELCFAGTAPKSVSVKSIFFEQISVNGIPLHAPPIYKTLKLKEGKEFENFPMVRARVAFREMHSLRPMRDIVADRRARIDVSVLVQLDLNPVEMFALRALSAWASFEVDADQPVSLPGGVLSQSAAFAALTAAEPVWIFSNQAREWRREHSALAQRAKEGVERILASIDCTFAVRSERGSITQVHNQSLGFLLPSGRILTTDEAVEPWKFDPALVEAFTKHKAFLVSDSVEVRAKVAGSESEFSTLREEVRVLGRHDGGKLLVSGYKQPSFRLQLRNDEDNLAILELGTPRQTSLNEQAVEIAGNSEWRPAAVFYQSSHPVVFTTEVKWENGQIFLKEPVPPAAFGSPVWVENGIAGIMQEEDSAAAAKVLRKAFPAEKF